MAEVKLPQVPDYPGNSDSDKENAHQVEKVVKGAVVVRKKGVLGRIRDILIADDIDNVKEYAISEVIIPGLKNLIVDSVSMLVLGSTFSRKGGRDDREKVSYKTMYKSDRRGARRERERDRDQDDTPNWDEVYYETLSDADDVLSGMYDLLKEYDEVTVKDLYDLSGYKSSIFDDNYGWTSLRGVEIKRNRHGYYLNLPKPYSID